MFLTQQSTDLKAISLPDEGPQMREVHWWQKVHQRYGRKLKFHSSKNSNADKYEAQVLKQVQNHKAHDQKQLQFCQKAK